MSRKWEIILGIALLIWIGVFFVIVFFVDTAFMSAYTTLLLLVAPLFIIWGLKYHFGVARKPILKIKARLVEKEMVRGRTGVSYYARFSLPNDEVKNFDISKEQYDLLRVDDVVILTHKGYKCISFQRITDKAPIMNKDFRVRKKHRK